MIVCDLLGMVVKNRMEKSASMVLAVGGLPNPNGAGRGTERDIPKKKEGSDASQIQIGTINYDLTVRPLPEDDP